MEGKENLDMEAKESRVGLAIHILLVFIAGIYPLLLFEVDFGSFALQHLILFLCTMGVLLYCVLLIRSGKWEIHFPRTRVNLMVAILAAYSLIRILYKIVITNEENLESFGYEIVVLAMAALYVLIISRAVFREFYFDILLYSSLVVFALLLIKYFCGNGVDGAIAVLLQDKSGIGSYTVLVCMAGVWQYIKCEDKLRSFFYLGVLVIGFFVLFVNQSRVSFWIMAAVFIAVPILQRPTAELVKRDMTVFFIYLFLLCNMSLITSYTNLLYIDVTFDLEQSVYLELLITLGGICFFRYWDRIPEGVDLRRLVMRRMRRGYQFLLRSMSVIAAGMILGGNLWKELPDRFGMKAWKGFAIPLIDEINQEKSTFYLCFEQFGVIGSLLLLSLCVLLVAELKKKYRFDKPVTGMLVLISGVFLAQLLFCKVSISILPVYWMFLILATSYKEKEEKWSVTKIKFE